jgi:hypothetical protein
VPHAHKPHTNQTKSNLGELHLGLLLGLLHLPGDAAAQRPARSHTAHHPQQTWRQEACARLSGVCGEGGTCVACVRQKSHSWLPCSGGADQAPEAVDLGSVGSSCAARRRRGLSGGDHDGHGDDGWADRSKQYGTHLVVGVEELSEPVLALPHMSTVGGTRRSAPPPPQRTPQPASVEPALRCPGSFTGRWEGGAGGGVVTAVTMPNTETSPGSSWAATSMASIARVFISGSSCGVGCGPGTPSRVKLLARTV